VRIHTIGVYGSTAEEFFSCLVRAEVDLFVDIRQRRGMRGTAYAFVNSVALQDRLAALGIKYLYLKELAPTSEVRSVQRAADATAGVAKARRGFLSPEFVSAYLESCAALRHPEVVVSRLGGAIAPCFFCVECEPQACHRSIVADTVARYSGAPVNNLMPCVS
jgi:uncharacterized protein (DUF488 family)